jgi:stage II sporulation protein D
MFTLIAILSLLSLPAQSIERSDAIRIGLFSLFNPQVVEARIASGERAKLYDDGSRGTRLIFAGDTARFSIEGGNIKITVRDSQGRRKQLLAASEARIVPEGAAMIELILPGRLRRPVRGEVSFSRAEQRSKAQLNIVLTTNRESAVASVVAAELSGQRATESFKALAVVSRTFMLAHAGRHSNEGFDFCDTTHCQFYRGEQDLARQTFGPMVASSVAQTAGEHLAFRDQVIEGYYTAVCGGLSVAPEMVWGGATKSGYDYERIACHWCRSSPYRRWERAASFSQALEALSAALGFKLSAASDILVEKYEADDLVRSVIIRDQGREEKMSVEQFRRAIGRGLGWSKVLSPSFTVERRGERLIFRGRGFGSRVGFCLAGAIAQAKAGRSYREILRYYFPKADIKGRLTNE